MSEALVDRRTVLKGGLAVGAALGLAAAVRLPSPAMGHRVLSGREALIVAAVAQAMFPKGPFPIDGIEAGVVERVDEILEDGVTMAAHVGFRYLLRTLEWGTLASRGVFFTDLPVEQRREVLDAWRSPGIMVRRVAADALVMVMGMAYFGHPDVLDHIGWRAACSGGTT